MRHPMQWFLQQLTVLILVLFMSVHVCAEGDPVPPFELATEPDYSALSIANKNIAELRKVLPLYEIAAMNPWAPLPTDIKLKRGMKNIAVMALRGHLKATGDLKPEQDTGLVIFDKNVMNAVQHFQSRHGLTPDGVVGPATIDALNTSPNKRLQQIQLNIDRWTKLSEELTDRYILINIPDYRLDLIEYGHKVLSMKAIVGKPERPTPEINSTVTRIVFNPYWNIPKMIAEEDIVPKAINNPDYLDDMHIRVFERQDTDAAELDPHDVDWNSAQDDGLQYHLRQDPGNDNALGLVKFEFPNSNDVYMHDTPAKNLFNLDKRAFSSGCIRLEKPFELVTYLMQDDPEWTNDMLEQILAANTTKYQKVSRPTRVIITYLTAWVDDEGDLQFRDDLYGLDGISDPIY